MQVTAQQSVHLTGRTGGREQRPTSSLKTHLCYYLPAQRQRYLFAEVPAGARDPGHGRTLPAPDNRGCQ
jgi:hypothetical protein